jgi:hypothetical protein
MLKRVILGDGENMFLDDLKEVADTIGMEGLVFTEQEFEDGQHLLAGFPADDAEDMRNLHNMVIENCDLIEAAPWMVVNTENATGWTLTTVIVGNYEINWVGVQ